MWIKGIKIDGFGILRDFEINNLSPGLNIIYGYNENGKTTLKNFITSILFGFKDRRNVIKRYEPVNGGTHGGKLVFNYKDQRCEASRFYKKKSEGDLEVICSGQLKFTLSEILAGINRDVYENVFSFGLEELGSLNSLTDKKEIVEQIYTASFGVKTDLIKNVKKELEGQLDNIYKDGNNSKKLLNQNLEEYKVVKKAILEAMKREEKYGELKERLQGLAIQREEIEKEKLDLERELIKSETLYNYFPTYQQYLEIERKVKELSYKGEYSEGDYNSLQTLIGELEKLREEKEEKGLELTKIQINLDNITLDNRLLEKKEKLKKLGEWAISIKEINKNYQDNRNKWEELNKRISTAKISLIGKLQKEVEEIFLPIGFKKKLEELEEKINNKMKEEEQKGWEISQLKENFHTIKGEDIGETLSMLYQLKDWENKKGIYLPKVLLLLNTSILFFLVWQGDYPFLTIFFALSIIPLNFWLIYNWVKDKNNRIKIKSALKDKGVINFNNIDLEINKFQTLESNYQKLQRILEIYNSIVEDLRDLEGEKEQLFSEVGFKGDLSIKEGLDLVEEISKIQGLLGEAEEYKLKFNGEKEKINNFIQICKIEIDDKLTSLEDALITVNQKLELLKTEEEKVEKYKGLKGQLEFVYRDIQRILKEEREKEEKYKELLDKGGVKTPQEYEENYQKYLEGKKLLEMKNTYLAKLEGVNLGSIQEVLKIYSEINEQHLTRKIRDLIEMLQDKKEKIEEISKEIGKLEKEIEDLEKNSSLQQLALTEERIKNQIIENVKRWAIYKSSLTVLEKAIKEYEEKTQPDVLKRAAEYFTIITDGRYNNIKVKDNELINMFVVQPNGKEIPVEALSRGTQEQLYICIRLGLIKEFSDKKGPLPLLFDDIFVNFDEQRMAKGFNVLQQLAKEQQILFFTCHQRVLDLLQKEKVNTVNLAFLS
ncbi:ATP-binding protein [Anaerobranca gottschalkii]|uniref:Uncharacterized protein YhaN n=1 Tax=Anaerobranca gottschalkii DSM 13577 TaxID=1120990 RepID=A0A1H9ZTI3_9FIRM|nr:AAA family ATPase [Anaerobranca gottschalkii]SES85028.1 Uncharacterized protein YhaN [Anaerobranca gottschalkii DSM 13577]